MNIKKTISIILSIVVVIQCIILLTLFMTGKINQKENLSLSSSINQFEKSIEVSDNSNTNISYDPAYFSKFIQEIISKPYSEYNITIDQNKMDEQEVSIRMERFLPLIDMLKNHFIIKALNLTEQDLSDIFFNPDDNFKLESFLPRIETSLFTNYMTNKAKEAFKLTASSSSSSVSSVPVQPTIRDYIVRETCEFYRTYEDYFTAMEMETGVSRFIVAGILTVETRTGFFTGFDHVAGTFAAISSFSISKDLPRIMDSVKSAINRELRNYNVSENTDSTINVINPWSSNTYTVNPDVVWQEMEAMLYDRIITKKTWAFNNLISLIALHQKGYLDLNTLYGSWAGAFGLCQFLPLSYLNTAVDGNNDGQINLFDPVDAIFSCANYLVQAGYDPNDEQAVYDAIWDYNHLDSYVRKVQGYAKSIQEVYELEFME